MMIRKVTLNLSFANIGKLLCLELILEEAKRVINLYIDRLWEAKQFSGKFVDFKVKTWLSARIGLEIFEGEHAFYGKGAFRFLEWWL